MAGMNVFHVAFGINETELTRALEQRQWNRAESLIFDNSGSSYLDEGCYQRTPLFIVLCGLAEDGSTSVRNFFIAKQLAQHGADINYRVPATYFGSEYMSPGKTALELAVEFYNQITLHISHPCVDDKVRGWDIVAQPVIGLDGNLITSFEDLLDQIEDLVLIMISNGGDVNICDENRMTLLHRAVVFSDNVRMAKLLCENGAGKNIPDAHGNSPLVALCEAFPLGIDKFSEINPSGNPYQDCCNVHGKEEFVDYLLEQSDVEINHQNKFGRTCLFNCMVRGDISTAVKLLKKNCDPSLRGQVKEVNEYITKTCEISPLFGALCSNTVITDHQKKGTVTKLASFSFLHHLLDSGYFERPEIYRELVGYIDNDFSEFDHLKSFQGQLLNLLFGGTSSSLRQLCARTLFNEIFIKHGRANHCLFEHPSVNATFRLEDFSHPTDFNNIYLKHILTNSVLERLVTALDLPRDSLVYLQIELFRLRLFSKFRQFRWFRYHSADDSDCSLDDSDEDQSSENDSDLEYW